MHSTLQIETIPILRMEFSAGNPRSDAAEDLEGLAASLGEEKRPMLVNPPVVQRSAHGKYQVIAGERRVRAAQIAGWHSIPCQVRELNAHSMHQRRVVENLHRKALNPFDQAIALKISWLIANGDALELEQQIEKVLHAEKPQAHILSDLEELLERSGFTPTRPPVSWDDVLNHLGIEMKPDSRKKLMRVLAVDPKVQEKVRGLSLTEAALRSLGTLEVSEQKKLAKELDADPKLARKVRRIARVVRAGTHTLEEALAEVKGQVSTEEIVPTESTPVDERLTGLVIQLLEAATTVRQSVDGLRDLLGGDYLDRMPEVWRAYADEAFQIVRTI